MVTSTRFVCSTANSSLVYFHQQNYHFDEILCKNFMISSLEDFSLRLAPTLIFLLSFLKVRSPWVRTLPTRWFFIFLFYLLYLFSSFFFYSCPTCPPGDSAGPQCTPPSTPGSPPDIFNGFIPFLLKCYTCDKTHHLHFLLGFQKAGNNFFQLPQLRLHSSTHFQFYFFSSFSSSSKRPCFWLLLDLAGYSTEVSNQLSLKRGGIGATERGTRRALARPRRSGRTRVLVSPRPRLKVPMFRT